MEGVVSQAKGVRRYRKKPVVVEAIRWVWPNWNDICDFVPVPDVLYVPDEEEFEEYPTLKIRTLEGEMNVPYGHYIIKGVKGEYYACDPEIFAQTYEEVGEEDLSGEEAAIKAIMEGKIERVGEVLLYEKGKMGGSPYRCNCGCNVFSKYVYDGEKYYRCNFCRAIYKEDS